MHETSKNLPSVKSIAGAILGPALKPTAIIQGPVSIQSNMFFAWFLFKAGVYSRKYVYCNELILCAILVKSLQMLK